MSALAYMLEGVLGHAVSALEHEDRNEPSHSLQEYNNAWVALSYALEGFGDRVPAVVRETCAALLETYSARYEAVREGLAIGCNSWRGGAVVRSAHPSSHAASCSCYPTLPTGACTTPAASDGRTEVYGTVFEATDAGPPVESTEDDTTHRLRRRLEEPQCPAMPADASGICGRDAGGGGTAADAATGGGGTPAGAMCSAEGADGTTGGGGAGGGCQWGSAPAAAVLMTDQMSEVFQMCYRPIPEHGGLDDMAGLESVKEEVRLALLMPMRMPHLFRGIRQPARNFLLHGPPGTGKTMLVERIAAEAGATLLVLTPGTILSKWSGESEKQLRAVFDVARAMQPCIVFMDEVDSLAPMRGSGDDPIARRLLNELLVQMSCLASGAPGPGQAAAAAAAGGGGGVGLGSTAGEVYVFAATNRLQDCDPALLRRFDRRMAVPLPDLTARQAFLEGVLQRPELAGHMLSGEEVARLAERTDGYSGSDLAQLCREAAMQPVRELLRHLAGAGAGGRGDKTGGGAAWSAGRAAAAGGGRVPAGPRPLVMQDFEWALDAVQPVTPAAG